MPDPTPTKIDQARIMLRQNPQITAEELRKALNLTSKSVAVSLLVAAKEEETRLAARLATEDTAAEIQAVAAEEEAEFYVTDSLGQAHQMELIKEGRRRVVFKLLNPSAEITFRKD